MENHEIQRILDDLDVQLAGGKIDLATYQALTQKWSARLAGTASAPPPPPPPMAAAAPATAVAVRIACPNCGAPPGDDMARGSNFYRCPYCATQFSIEVAQQETEKLKQELQGWLSSMVSGVSMAGGGMVDAVSRAHIFREKLYPSLQLEFNRAVELVDGFREWPLFSVQAGSAFAEYAAESSPLRSARQRLSPIRNLTGKLSAPVVREFVMEKADEKKLARMQLQASELIHTANLVEQSAKFSSSGYSAARENAEALKELYAGACETTEAPAEKQFLQACMVRLDAAQIGMDVMSRIYSSSGRFMGSSYGEELKAASRRYDEALNIADRSGFSPIDTVPWRQGVEKEQALVVLQASLLASYDRIAANRDTSFFDFQTALADFVRQSGAPVSNPADLSTLAEGLATIVEARRGTRALPRYADWSWRDGIVEANRKKAMFGGGETVEAVDHYWQPFWIATVHFSQSEGAIFKSGVARQALLAVDATNANSHTCSLIDESNPARARLEASTRSASVETSLTLPELVSERTAQRALESFAKSSPAMRNARVTMLKVVYLPVAEVIYASREGKRAQAFTIVSAFQGNTQQLRRSTANFMAICSR
jgi:hypothetical protein